ncbi:MAG: hypothetical protein AAGI50_15675 [Pseudomonadota bacterium]
MPPFLSDTPWRTLAPAPSPFALDQAALDPRCPPILSPGLARELIGTGLLERLAGLGQPTEVGHDHDHHHDHDNHDHEHPEIIVDPVPRPVEGSALRVFVVDVSGSAGEQEVLAELTDGAVLDAALFEGREVTLFATANGAELGSVGMRLRGVDEDGQRILTARTLDDAEPYALGGDTSGDFLRGAEVGEGIYDLDWIAFEGAGGTGARLERFGIEFTVADIPPPPEEPPAPDNPFENGVLTEYTSGSDDGSGFNIDLDFIGADWTVEIQDAFIAAAEFLSAAIIGDVPSHTFGGETIDDLAINVILEPIDGRGSVLGFAGPRNIDGATFMPYRGEATFDTADVDSLNASGQLDDVVVHEFFHVLGFGTLFSFFDLYDDATERYTGGFGTAMYNEEFASVAAGDPGSLSGIPMQPGGGHFDEGSFDEELNTPTFNGTTFISDMSFAVLEDIGWDTYLDNPFDPTDLAGPAPGAIEDYAFL